MHNRSSILKKELALHAFFTAQEKKYTCATSTKIKLLHQLVALNLKLGKFKKASNFLDNLDNIYSNYKPLSQGPMHTLTQLALLAKKVENEKKNLKLAKEQNKKKQQIASIDKEEKNKQLLLS
jgi:hypothetical protein